MFVMQPSEQCLSMGQAKSVPTQRSIYVQRDFYQSHTAALFVACSAIRVRGLDSSARSSNARGPNAVGTREV